MYRGRGKYAVTIPAGAGAASSPVLNSRVRLHGWSMCIATTTSEIGAVDADFAAGVAGLATLPAGASLTGFTVTTASTAAVENGTVTVSNVTGGPLSFAFTSPNGGNSDAVLSPPIPFPLVPNGGQITVGINAITGGAAGHIVAFYTLGTTEAIVTFLDGAQSLAMPAVQPGIGSTVDISGEGIYVGTQLNIIVTGGTVSGVVWVSDEGSALGKEDECHDRHSSSPPPSQPALQ